MTYTTAFIMVARVLLWAVLIVLPAYCFFLHGTSQGKWDGSTRMSVEDQEDKAVFDAICLFFGAASYTAVILCARYVP